MIRPTKKQALLTFIVLLPLLLWSSAVIALAGGVGGVVWGPRTALAFAAFVALTTSLFLHRRAWIGVVVTFGVLTAAWATTTPTLDRDWLEFAQRTPYATVDGSKVTIHDVRNFRYQSNTEWTPGWYDETYDVNEIEQGYLVLTRFGGIDGLAHVMVSFRFKGDKYLVLSVEIRKEVGESYHPIGGAMRQYELFYVAADERDAIALRTHVHKDETWLIPMNAGKEKTGEFFLDMTRRMTKLHSEPEWYNSFTSSCASNLASHYETVNNVTFPPDYRVLLPGFSEELLAELDLLPAGMSVADAQAAFKVNSLVDSLPVDEGYSKRLRPKEFPPTP
jgi:hypothetical protein